ncbi:MAG: hypothetical protein GF383_14170 [Candidatus Lokiarchaeota archaeon]|nr:hypothetical protein [Candidatus Lokiarchaeota archaeon]MBD3342503.1 hypothetical protein [Candidatus Lokiarchaeota archaeon]
MTFEKLGPLIQEDRTTAVCEICKNYIYRRVYYDESAEKKKKVVFVCKNCLNNNNHD